MKPKCHNRPPREKGYWRAVVTEAGEVKRIWIDHTWSPDRCATWDGTGITGPAATHAPYPVAHGWDCSGCRWLPEVAK